MVLEEADEEQQRKLEHAVGRRRPDRRAHRQQVLVDETVAVAPGAQVFAERRRARDAAAFEIAHRFAVEAQDVGEHAVIRRLQQVAPLREQRIQIAAAVLETARVAAHAEAHLGRLRRDAERVEQFDEVRVGPVVVDDEAGVDRVVAAAVAHVDRRGMPADARRRLVNGDLVARIEIVGGGKPGDAGADDRDLHRPHAPRASVSVVACATIYRS